MVTEKVKIPAALSMMLKSFGIDAEKITTVVNEIVSKSETFIADGTLDRIFNLVATVERIESKLDSILEKIKTETEQINGESRNKS